MKLTNLTAKEKRELDNLVNKLNKRAMTLAKTGMGSSATYKEITAQMQQFKSSFRNEQIKTVFGGKAPASGTAGKIREAVAYKTVMTPDGSTISVPQISRSSIVLAFAKGHSNIDNAVLIGTGMAERATMEGMLEEIYDLPPTDTDLQMALEMDDMRKSMQSYAWDMLYGLKNVEEVRAFLEDEMEGKKYSDGEIGEAEQKADNERALALYAKYASHVNKDEVRKRPVSKRAHAYLWGALDPSSGKYSEGAAQKSASALARAIRENNVVEQVQYAEKYLGQLHATAGYAGDDAITYYKPTTQEIMDLIEWMKGDL